jgi:predicted transglutaminase-like cysteine proteinase
MSRADLVQEINARVNTFPYETDMSRFHAPDFWERIADGGRDCEDFALEKRAQLLQAGVPLSDIAHRALHRGDRGNARGAARCRSRIGRRLDSR